MKQSLQFAENKKYEGSKRMVKAILLCFIALLSQRASSQIDAVDLTRKIDAVVTRNRQFSQNAQVALGRVVDSEEQIVTTETYKRFVDEYFTYLSYNRGTLPTGNSAAIDLSENETQLKLSLSKKVESQQSNKGILIATAGLQAKLGDNIATLFNGANATTGTTIFGNFAFLPGQSQYKMKGVISEFGPNGDSVPTPFEKLNIKRDQFKKGFDQKYTDEYERKYKALVNRWVEVNNAIKSSTDNKSLTDLFKEKDEIEKTLKDAGLLDKEPAAIASAIQEKYQNDLFTLETDEPTWEWIKLSWFSGSVKYTRETYNTYDEALLLSQRFDKKNFDSWGAGIARHWFKERVQEAGFGRVSYFNISYNLARTNNYLGISDQTITKSIVRGTSGDTTITMVANNNTKNITGKKFNTGWKHTIGSTYTAMLGKKQSLGINLLGNVQISNFTSPIYNTHVGFLFRFMNNQKDPDDKKSPAKVNFEVFIEFPDMTDVGNSNNSAWQNKVIGASVSVPFSKIFFK